MMEIPLETLRVRISAVNEEILQLLTQRQALEAGKTRQTSHRLYTSLNSLRRCFAD